MCAPRRGIMMPTARAHVPSPTFCNTADFSVPRLATENLRALAQKDFLASPGWGSWNAFSTFIGRYSAIERYSAYRRERVCGIQSTYRPMPAQQLAKQIVCARDNLREPTCLIVFALIVRLLHGGSSHLRQSLLHLGAKAFHFQGAGAHIGRNGHSRLGGAPTQVRGFRLADADRDASRLQRPRCRCVIRFALLPCEVFADRFWIGLRIRSPGEHTRVGTQRLPIADGGDVVGETFAVPRGSVLWRGCHRGQQPRKTRICKGGSTCRAGPCSRRCPGCDLHGSDISPDRRGA